MLAGTIKIIMKKVFMLLTVATLALASCGGGDKKDDKKEGEKKEAGLKDHLCTERCHEAGHCVMAHGEKGHECSDECKM